MDFKSFPYIENITICKSKIDILLQQKSSFPFFQANQDDFFLDVKGVACFNVQNGNKIVISPYEGADEASIRLFLNGSVFGALLHQKGILPLHGCSFRYQDRGIVICGNSGVGKSSVTTAFCQNGADFITDDITPLQINETETVIKPIKTQIKLWDDSIKKLQIENTDLKKIRPALEKFYLPSPEPVKDKQQLNHLFILRKHNKSKFITEELNGIDKYNALRKQIYRKLYLKGMPETEKKYFRELLQLSGTVKVTRIIRPDICSIYDTMHIIEKEISR